MSRRANCVSRRRTRGTTGVPHATVRCEDGKIDAALLRASLGRFNETTDDGWRWTVEALAAHLLHHLCAAWRSSAGWNRRTAWRWRTTKGRLVAEYGFNRIKLADDWLGADFVACHEDGNAMLRVRLEPRLTVDRKYLYRRQGL